MPSSGVPGDRKNTIDNDVFAFISDTDGVQDLISADGDLTILADVTDASIIAAAETASVSAGAVGMSGGTAAGHGTRRLVDDAAAVTDEVVEDRLCFLRDLGRAPQSEPFGVAAASVA